MTYNLLALYTEVGNQFDSQASTRAKGWVVEAIHDIIAMRRWSYAEAENQIATVSGQALYVVSGTSPVIPDFDGIIDVRHNLANGGTQLPKLTFLKQPEFDEMFGFAISNTGIPVAYTLRGGSAQASSAAVTGGGNIVLQLTPTPNYIGAMKIAYYRSMASVEISADTDIPILPAQFRQAIINYAIAIGKARTDQMIASNVAMQFAMQQLQALEQADIASRGGDPEEPIKVPPQSIGVNPSKNPYGWEPID